MKTKQLMANQKYTKIPQFDPCNPAIFAAKYFPAPNNKRGKFKRCNKK